MNQTLDYDSLSYSASLDYPIEIEGNILYPGGSVDAYNERKMGNHKRADWAWRWSLDLFEFGLDNGFIVLKKSRNGLRIYTKTYQYASISKTNNSYGIEYKDRLKPIQSIDFIGNKYSNDNAKKELSKIFSTIPFDYPKPSSIMNTFLRILPNYSTILDFFAGSGTTLHATMQLNAEDAGHRQCILVTNNENNICEEVTYERNKRVINGYTTPKGVKVEGLTHNNLRYYKTEFISRDRTVKNMRALVAASTELLCIKENVYLKQKGFGSLPNNPNVYRYFEENGNRMLVIYQEEFIPIIVEELGRMAKDIREGSKDNPLTHGPLKVYVFSPDRDPYADEI